ncbi:MAG: hypothetical protein WA060_00005, partial [Minisyncoccia bacterium]
PELVITDTAGYKNLDYSKLTAVLAGGIQELDLNLSALSGTITPLEGSETESFVNAFFANLFTKITVWLADAGNGVANIFTENIESKKSSTENFCIKNESGETCITREQLEALLVGAGITPTPTPEPEPEPTLESTPEPIPAPEVDPEPAPEESLGSSPTAEPGDVVPDETPAPTPTPELIPEPEATTPEPEVASGPDPEPTPEEPVSVEPVEATLQ